MTFIETDIDIHKLGTLGFGTLGISFMTLRFLHNLNCIMTVYDVYITELFYPDTLQDFKTLPLTRVQ